MQKRKNRQKSILFHIHCIGLCVCIHNCARATAYNQRKTNSVFRVLYRKRQNRKKETVMLPSSVCCLVMGELQTFIFNIAYKCALRSLGQRVTSSATIICACFTKCIQRSISCTPQNLVGAVYFLLFLSRVFVACHFNAPHFGLDTLLWFSVCILV